MADIIFPLYQKKNFNKYLLIWIALSKYLLNINIYLFDYKNY